MELKYFKLEEFDSPDVPGSGSYMDPELLLMLDEAGSHVREHRLAVRCRLVQFTVSKAMAHCRVP